MKYAIFSISKVKALRNRAAETCPQPDDEPNGWSKSKVDPMDLLGVFESLGIKPGFILRAYRFQGGLGGNGIVWAMPADVPFPDVSECPRLTDQFLEPPKPPLALDNIMDAIEGDGCPSGKAV